MKSKNNVAVLAVAAFAFDAQIDMAENRRRGHLQGSTDVSLGSGAKFAHI